MSACLAVQYFLRVHAWQYSTACMGTPGSTVLPAWARLAVHYCLRGAWQYSTACSCVQCASLPQMQRLGEGKGERGGGRGQEESREGQVGDGGRGGMPCMYGE